MDLTKLTFDVFQDSTDFRDHIYEPSLRQIPRKLYPKAKYIDSKKRDQGANGACTGYGLAAVIDYINAQRADDGVIDKFERVSPHMLYAMAKRYDRWPGEEYEGSSARGAMKGWHKHGVCSLKVWPTSPDREQFLTPSRQASALRYPLGAYYRVQARRSDVHAALSEVGAVFATAKIHSGWENPKKGRIKPLDESDFEAQHAFAILGYNEEGFIIQNSWGEDWSSLKFGRADIPGLAIWTYSDFDQNLMDAWVAQMALEVESLTGLAGRSIVQRPDGARRVELGPPRNEIYYNFIHIDDGQLNQGGRYHSDIDQVEKIVQKASEKDHILLYAHGGLNSVFTAARRAAQWRPAFERNGIHEIHFIWETGLFEEIWDLLRSKVPLVSDRVGSSVSEWWDRMLEKATWTVGRPLWREMHRDAEVAFEDDSAEQPAGALVVEKLSSSLAGSNKKIHLVGHSAGAIWLAHLLKEWPEQSIPVENLCLFAPGCTHELFKSQILEAVKKGRVNNVYNFNLSDARERDDTVKEIYRKSLLYLVSNSYEKRARELIGPPTPLLGLQKFWESIEIPAALNEQFTFYVAGRDSATNSRTHGGFDSDPATMNTMLRLVLDDQFDEAKKFQAEELED